MPEPFIFFSPPTATQLKAVMSDVEVLPTLPEIRVERGTCTCHLIWRITTGADSDFFYSECYAPQLWQLWLWLLDISLGNNPALLYLCEDLRYESFWLVEYTSATDIEGWLWVQENKAGEELRGEYVNPDQHLRFKGSAQAFIACLQQSLVRFFYNEKDYLHAFDYIDDYNQDYRHMTVREWPWGIFHHWHKQRQSFTREFVLKGLLGTFSQFEQHSFLFQMGRDSVDCLAFEYAWSLMIRDLLCVCVSYNPQAFDALCEPITDFLDETNAAWNNFELYGNFDEAAYAPYEEPEDRDKKACVYRSFLSQWRAEQLCALALIPLPLETCFHWNITLPRESKGAENA